MAGLLILIVVLTIFFYATETGNKTRKAFKDTYNRGWNSDSPFRGRHTHPPENRTIDKGSMARCHNCGIFFPETRVVNKVMEGHLLQFCSTNCRDHFMV